MMSLTFGLFTQVSGSGPLGPLVLIEKVLHTKNREALGVSGFTIVSVKHCFLYIFHTKSASH